MNKEQYREIEDYMRSCMDDSAHDSEHIYRVLSNALVIAQSEQNVDYDILIASCLLHDIGRPDQIRDPSLCHAAVGSEKAYYFLTECGYDASFAQSVKDCIRTHRFRKNDQPQSVEAKILFDADKLDVVGALGVARTLVYKGTVSDPLYTRKNDGTVSDGTDESTSSFFQEYKFKLENLYARFYTSKGREMALQRKPAAEAFYQSLYSEVTDLDAIGKNMLSKLLK